MPISVRLCAMQIVVCVLMALLASAIDLRAGVGVAAGGCIAIVADIVFAMNVFAASAKDNPRRALRAFYAGEGFKILTTVTCFLIAVNFFKEQWLMVMAGYILVLLMHWPALLFDLK